MAAFSIGSFEAAVLLVTSPPAGTVAGGSEERLLAQASEYIQQLAAQPDAYRLCLQLLVETSQPAARFFSLQALAQFVLSPGYAALDATRLDEVRGALLNWTLACIQNGSLLSQPSYVRTKLAVVFAAILRVDYPIRRPGAFQEMLLPLVGGMQQLQASLALGEPCPSPSDPTLRLTVSGVDLFLRILNVLQDDIAEARIHRPDASERSQAGLVKDALRCGWTPSQQAVASAAASGSPPPSPAPAVVPWLVQAWQSIVTSLCVVAPGMSAAALDLMARYADWIDIHLLANDAFLQLFYGLLMGTVPRGAAVPGPLLAELRDGAPSGDLGHGAPVGGGGPSPHASPRSPSNGGRGAGLPLPVRSRVRVRGPVVRVLHALCGKGMEPGARVHLVQACRLPELLAALTSNPAGLLPDGDGHGSAAEPSDGSSSRALLQSYAAALRDDGGDAGGGGARDGGDDDDWGVSVSQLLCTAGQALLSAGETPSVLASVSGNAAAQSWLSSSIRSCVGAAVGIVELAHRDRDGSAPLFLEVLPLLNDIVTAFHREAKASAATTATGASGGVAPSGHKRVPSSNSLGPASPPAQGSSVTQGSTSPLPKAFEGRPAGVSMSEPGLLPRLLEAIPCRMAYPHDFVMFKKVASKPASSGGADEDSLDDAGDEVQEARDGVRKLFVNVSRAAPESVAGWIASSPAAACGHNLGCIAALLEGRPSSMSWQSAESVLSLLYNFGEGAAAYATAALKSCGREGSSTALELPAISSASSSAPSPFASVVSSVLGCSLAPSTHPSLILLYHELAARYHSVLTTMESSNEQGLAGQIRTGQSLLSTASAPVLTTPLLRSVLQAMVGPPGLQHPFPQVRSRVAYLLLKTIRSLVRSDTSRDAACLAPFVDALLNGVGPFLAIPSIPQEVIQQIQNHADGKKGRGLVGDLRGKGDAALGGGKLSASSSLVSRRDRSSSLATPFSSDLLSTHGSSGLGPEDQQYLFELVGLLLGSSPHMPNAPAAASSDIGAAGMSLPTPSPSSLASILSITPDRRMTFIRMIVDPMGRALEEGLGHLQQMQQSRDGVSGPTGVAGSHRDNAGSPADRNWPPELVAEVAAWIVRSLNALGHMTKGFGSVPPPPAAGAACEPSAATLASCHDTLASLLHRCLGLAMRALGVLPSHPHVRSKAVFLLHRLVDCLDVRLLPSLPDCMPLLLAAPTPDDMVAVLVLLNQVASRFKAASAPLLNQWLIPVVTYVFALMPPQSMPASSGSSVAPAAVSSIPVSAVNTDDSRARVELTRAYFAFLSHMAGQPGLAMGVLASPGPNLDRLFDILDGLAEGIAAAGDTALVKTGLGAIGSLVKVWLPLKAHHQAQGQGVGAGATGATSAPASFRGNTGGGGVGLLGKATVPFPSADKPAGASSSSGGSSSSSRIEALPSPLQPHTRVAFLQWLSERGLRVTWTAALSPGCAEVPSGVGGVQHANGALLLLQQAAAGPPVLSSSLPSSVTAWEGNAGAYSAFIEAISLQATIALHVAVATGAPIPSSTAAAAAAAAASSSLAMGPSPLGPSASLGGFAPSTPAASPASVDMVSHMVYSVLPRLVGDLLRAAVGDAAAHGVLSGPLMAAAGQMWVAYGEKLRGCLAAPAHKDARPAYVACVKAIRALLAVAATSSASSGL